MPEIGTFLERQKYRIKCLNLINFKKSMRYNPLAYIRSEKDILKLVKLQLEDKVDWDISTYTLSGTTDMQDCFTTGFPLSVLVPDESSVAAARRMIRELING